MFGLVKASTGLSPRVRGNLPPADHALPIGRSIPARAGEPSAPANHGVRQWVYPRACGGTVTSATPAGSVKGLSPRVRGNLRLLGQRQGRHRSIPARAGEPAFSRCSFWCPRSIPARAGEPSCNADSRGFVQVYPRACGGTLTTEGELTMLQGLSPRVRGNRDPQHVLPVGNGSIPARAGEPMLVGLASLRSRVYPRACGGTEYYYDARERPQGLSPRVRGNLAAGEGLG